MVGRYVESRCHPDPPETYDRIKHRSSGYSQDPLTTKEPFDKPILEARASTGTYKDPPNPVAWTSSNPPFRNLIGGYMVAS